MSPYRSRAATGSYLLLISLAGFNSDLHLVCGHCFVSQLSAPLISAALMFLRLTLDKKSPKPFISVGA